MKGFVIVLLTQFCSFFAWSQPSNNSCGTPEELCFNTPVSSTNSGATSSICPNCEDDFTTCFAATNTVWYTFTTNSTGGDVQLDITNIVFEGLAGQGLGLNAIIFSNNAPCFGPSNTDVSNCIVNSPGNFSLFATALLPSTTYYVVICGAMGTSLPAAAQFDLLLTGPGVDRPVPGLFLGGPPRLCSGETAFFVVSPQNCPDYGLISWFIDGTLIAQTTDTTLTTAAIPNGAIVTASTSCYTLCPQLVTQNVGPIPVIDFPLDAGPDLAIVSGTTVQLNGQTTADTIIWTPSFNLSNDTIANPLATPSQTTTYTISATQNNCTKVDFVVITVSDYLVIPNTLSPNGDNTNDTWIIEGIENYPENYVQIYTRWGQKVFETRGYNINKAWDGSSPTGRLDPGSYYYIIELNDPAKTSKNGFISLIR